MLNELDIVRDVSHRLEALGLAYMLTGSMAMNYYAQPRMTRDVDLVIEIKPEHVDNLVRSFEADYYVSAETVNDAVSRLAMFNLIHQESVIKIDFIVRKDTPYRRGEFERRCRVDFGDFSTWITSKEDLILSKLVWAKDSRSELQLGDVANLLGSGCDTAYLDQWSAQLGVDELLGEVTG